MTQNNSNTESEKSISPESDKPLIKLLYLSTDQLLISQIIASNKDMVILRLPCIVSTVYNDDGSMVSFSLEPYLQPFSLFTESYPIGVNMGHIVSVTEPKLNMIEAYKQSSAKMDDIVQAKQAQAQPEEGDLEIEVDLEDDEEVAEDDEDFNKHFDRIVRKKDTILH